MMFHSYKRKLLLALATISIFSTVSANDGLPPEYVSTPEDGIPFTAAVKEKGKWGAIDQNGKSIIPISFDRIGISLSPSDSQEEDVTSEDLGRRMLIEVEKDNLRGFYNRLGKEIVPVSYESRSIWKEGALAVRDKNKKISFYKEDGTLISTSQSYDQVSDFECGMAIVKQGATYGYLSLDGKEIKPVYSEARYFYGGLAPVKEKGKWGVIDTAGQMTIPPTYKDTGPAFQEGLLAVKGNQNRWGFINGNGDLVVPMVYKEVSPTFSEGYAAVENENKLWGFVNAKGEVTIEPQFKAVLTPFSEGLAGVKTVDGNGYVKPDGSIAFMADYSRLSPFENGLAEIRVGQVSEQTVASRIPISIGIGWGWGHWLRPYHHHHHHPWGWGIGFPIWNPWYYGYETIPTIQVKRGYIDNTGKVIASPTNDRVFPATEKGILIFNRNRYGWVNRSGTFLAHTTYLGLIPVEDDDVLLVKDENKQWGMLSMTDGHEIRSASYKELKALGEGFYGYKAENGQWGILNKEGYILTEAKYQAVASCGEGYMPVKEKGSWHFIYKNGFEVYTLSDPISDVIPFHQGIAGVKIKGKWGLINKDGQFTVEPKYEDLDIL